MAAPEPAWVGLSDEALLDLRFCDLDLRMDQPRLERGISRLYEELERKGLRFRPRCWLAEEWFSPDGVPGIAVPFYLAHPRLARLERRMNHVVEGGTHPWFMRILRHEAGHAIDTAFGLRRRKAWRQVFGRASQPYPTRYVARPGSRRFVLHLGLWYAQSHPTEDFAETFAVWLPARSRWRSQYADWPALRKLEYVDRTMADLKGIKPRNSSRRFVEPLSENRKTLRAHYRRRQSGESPLESHRYDRRLLRVFAPAGRNSQTLSASRFLTDLRPRLSRELSRQVGMHPYLIHQVMDESVSRARILRLRLRHDPARSARDAQRMVEHIVLDTLNRNREHYAL